MIARPARSVRPLPLFNVCLNSILRQAGQCSDSTPSCASAVPLLHTASVTCCACPFPFPIGPSALYFRTLGLDTDRPNRAPLPTTAAGQQATSTCQYPLSIKISTCTAPCISSFPFALTRGQSTPACGVMTTCRQVSTGSRLRGQHQSVS